jgi:hypothetical protein
VCARWAGKFSHCASNGAFKDIEKKTKAGEEKETNIEILQRVFKQDMFIKRTFFSPTHSKTSD